MTDAEAYVAEQSSDVCGPISLASHVGYFVPLLPFRGSHGVYHTIALEDTEDLVTCTPIVLVFRISSLPLSQGCISIFLTGHDLDLGNTVAVPQDNTDLRRGDTLPGQLADLVDDLVGGGLQPRRRGARVWDGRVGDTLALAVQTTHFDVGVGPVDGGGLEGCGGRRRRRCWLTESSSQPSTLRENLAWVLAISGIQRNSSDASMSFRNLVSRLPRFLPSPILHFRLLPMPNHR